MRYAVGGLEVLTYVHAQVLFVTDVAEEAPPRASPTVQRQASAAGHGYI